MKRLVLATLLATVSFAPPVLAQGYYGPPGGYDAPPPPRYGPPRGYDDEYDRPRYRRPRDDDDYDRGPRRGGYRGGGSSICITSRGTCPVGAVVPRGSPCRCDIPGFGPKRGATN